MEVQLHALLTSALGDVSGGVETVVQKNIWLLPHLGNRFSGRLAPWLFTVVTELPGYVFLASIRFSLIQPLK